MMSIFSHAVLQKPVLRKVALLSFGVLLAGFLAYQTNWQPQPATLPSGEEEAVVLYATDWCPYCEKARQFFQRSNIAYTEYDVEKSTAGYKEYLRISGRGVPVITIGDRVIQGYNLPAIRRALADQGLTGDTTHTPGANAVN